MLLATWRNNWNPKSPEKVRIKTCYTGRRWSSLFKIKDNTKRQNGHDIDYHVNCPRESREDSYIGESGKRLVEHINGHNSKDNKLHVLKHSIEKRYPV